MKHSEKAEVRYISALTKALTFILDQCCEQNYISAMQNNGGHAAGTIRMCREAAERALGLYDNDFSIRCALIREQQEQWKKNAPI